MKLGTFLLSLLQPALAKILLSLGFSVVSIIGMQALLTQLKTSLVSSFSSLPADALSMFLLGGGGIALGIIFGALTTKLLLWQIQRSTQILGSNNG
ncbi:hypothetical protein GmRootV118_22910 [Variovorax sp. V118]|uniref:DUF2523 family protein n=1 Tax=Variovorax sp. V118 TaxID=3065954 RepID=UPI0034E8936D